MISGIFKRCEIDNVSQIFRKEIEKVGMARINIALFQTLHRNALIICKWSH